MNPGKNGKINQSRRSYIMNGKHQVHLTMVLLLFLGKGMAQPTQSRPISDRN